MMTSTQRYGLKQEIWAMEQIQRHGHTVRLISNFLDDFDMIIDECMPAEIKAARMYMRQVRPGYYRPTFCFDLSNINQEQDYVIFLICEDERARSWPYIIPSWLLQSRSGVAVTSHPRVYNGMWAKYLNRWETIDQVLWERKRLGQSLQLSFWDSILDPKTRQTHLYQKEGVYRVPA